MRPTRSTSSTILRKALAAVILASLAGLSLSGQGASRRDADFQHFPGGKAVPGLGVRNPVVAGPLAAKANQELPAGVRVRPGERPILSQAGANQLYRFALEYEGVPLAADTDYVAVLDPTGRVLASRARNLPETVAETQPSVEPLTAATAAADHARRTFGLAGAFPDVGLLGGFITDADGRATAIG